MPESDDEYVQTYSDEDDVAEHQVTSSRAGDGRLTARRSGRPSRPRGAAGGSRRGGDGASGDGGTGEGGAGVRADGGVDVSGGFEVSRTWENVVEGADGTITGAIDEMLEATKRRRRLLRDTTPLQRGIIRHVVLVLDMSTAMNEKDFRPTRHLLANRFAQEFCIEFFEQNPLAQLAVVGMRDGLAVRVSDMGGNPAAHVTALQRAREVEPRGFASLENALEMARGALFNTPVHGTREVVVILGAIFSADPGDIHRTIAALAAARIVCSVVGLAAEVAVCRTLVQKTNPSAGSSSSAAYVVAMDEQHFRELFMAATTPPASIAKGTGANNQQADGSDSSLLMMGFPSRAVDAHKSLCACHGRTTRSGYACPRCASKVCSLPCQCPVCSLTLILSTHLARSYHHLFPLRNWEEVSWTRARKSIEAKGGLKPSEPAERGVCFGCLTPFPEIPAEDPPAGATTTTTSAEPVTAARKDRVAGKPGQTPAAATTAAAVKPVSGSSGVSESGRYACPSCGKFFCIDCDVFAHEVVHNCPGCLSREGEVMEMLAAEHQRQQQKQQQQPHQQHQHAPKAHKGGGEGAGAGSKSGEGGEGDVVMVDVDETVAQAATANGR